jgi:predicted RND superfamily exporter protein
LKIYNGIVIEKPFIPLLMLFLLVGFFSFHVNEFKLDASSESLILENDEDFRYYRIIKKLYGSDDFLIITYTPFSDLLSPASLSGLKSLRDELSKIDRVESVTTILDVPLVNSPKVTLSELADEESVRTLETPGIDKELAGRELRESPIYQNNLVSADGKTTALMVTFKRDEKYLSLLQKRNELKEKKKLSGLTQEEAKRFARVTEDFDEYHATKLDRSRETIGRVREIMGGHRAQAQMYLGGVSMIVSDMISFIEQDITVFGLGVIAFLILSLAYFFRKLRWILLPMGCCVMTVSVMVGFLGYADWRVTVISSNFISLLLIITMSITIHLIVRYRILAVERPEATQQSLVSDTMRVMAEPCFYTAITTIVAFCSLVVSGIRPVIDFGWIMTIGITLAFILNFIFFPSVLVLMSREDVKYGVDPTQSFTLRIASLAQNHAKKIFVFSGVFAIVGILGIPQLAVDNRFIDHFKSSTEIYQGMELIDNQLGGTIPLDIVIDPAPEFFASLEELHNVEDPFDDPFAEEEDTHEYNYWFNNEMLGRVEEIHDYLEGLPEVGKVLSIATGMKVLKQLNDGRLPEDYELAVIRKNVPDAVKNVLIRPYLSEDANQTRLTMRLIESVPNLKRQDLLQKIQRHLVHDFSLNEKNVHLTGMAVLYNNLLQSLYSSQILTLGFVFVSILGMFLVLFRSVYLAVLAIIPNMLAACLVLGLMGWFGIPLDVMTITIAAITIGIAVDHAIHYIHRFQVEFKKYGHYMETVYACHGSIGRAIYYTAITITVGFSILALSKFIPTIYFGLLTGLAMVLALLSNLTLLPALLIITKPLGPARKIVLKPEK